MDKQDRQDLETRKLDRERAQSIEALIKTEGWKHYIQLLNSHIEKRTQSLLEPVMNGDSLASEHNKGTVYGLIYARDLPLYIIAADKDAKSSNPTEDEEHAD